ncbi:GntR family transcriptional regulator [Phyllobacterium sp. SB3]|uniref:GntR family transcriptional regulator n=1 Tax=Phyllobacterium sp. SB3 TaxID=3156073 RepID=UPI0032AECC58
MTLHAIQILRTSSLPMLLEQEIEHVILSGEFSPGDRIIEMEIALRFGTSRGPVREALRGLESSGLIEQVPKRGFFVRRLSAKQAADVYDVRAALFGLAGKLLAERITDDGITKLKNFVSDMDTAVAADDFSRYVTLNFAFHEFIVRGTGNTALAQQYLALIKHLRLYRARSLMFGDSMHASHAEHHIMVDAVAARDPAKAYAAHVHHVETAKQRLMSATPIISEHQEK